MAVLYTVPNPDHMEWQDWADTVVGYNAPLRNRLSPDLPWKEFVERLAQVVSKTPYHEGFEDWRAWARALRNALGF